MDAAAAAHRAAQPAAPLLKTRRRLAVVGLPNTGKSRIVNALQGKPGAPVEPTAGANKSSVVRDGETFDLLDLGGAPAVRKFWSVLAADADRGGRKHGVELFRIFRR